jgi:hypothetical protein
MESLTGALKLRQQAHLLIVNIEAGSGMRQTYVQKGQVIFSRLTPLAAEQNRDLDAMLLQQADQTRKYLERIKQLPYDVMLPVHVLVPPTYPVNAPEESSDKLLTFRVEQAAIHFRSGTVDQEGLEPGALALAMVQSLRGAGIKNVYAPVNLRRYYTLGRIASSMFLGAAAACLGTMLYMAPTLTDALFTREQETERLAQTGPLLEQYEALRGSFPETPINSTTMALVVRTHDLLLQQSRNPAELFGIVGQALEDAATMRLSSLYLELRALPAGPDEQVLLTGLESQTDLFRLAVMAGRTELVATLEGTVQSAHSFRAARDEVLAFIDTLRQNESIQVTPLIMPIDIRADTAVATVVDDSTVTERFQLEIVMRLFADDDEGVEGQP